MTGVSTLILLGGNKLTISNDIPLFHVVSHACDGDLQERNQWLRWVSERPPPAVDADNDYIQFSVPICNSGYEVSVEELEKNTPSQTGLE